MRFRKALAELLGVVEVLGGITICLGTVGFLMTEIYTALTGDRVDPTIPLSVLACGCLGLAVSMFLESIPIFTERD